MLGRIETRTRDRIYCQTMRTVRDISRDDRARIATCNLRMLTDRLKENYSIDDNLPSFHFLVLLAEIFISGVAGTRLMPCDFILFMLFHFRTVILYEIGLCLGW